MMVWALCVIEGPGRSRGSCGRRLGIPGAAPKEIPLATPEGEPWELSLPRLSLPPVPETPEGNDGARNTHASL